MSKKVVLSLYISTKTAKTDHLTQVIRNMCYDFYKDEYELAVYSVLEHPDIAEREHILATPTLVREFPLPRKHIIGDFNQSEKIASLLELAPNSQEHTSD